MDDNLATRIMNDGYLAGTPGRVSQACYFDCMEYDADHATHYGTPRGPAEESTEQLVSEWFSGAIVADCWCREFDGEKTWRNKQGLTFRSLAST